MAFDPSVAAQLQAVVSASPSVQALLKNASAFRGPHADIERFTAMLNALKRDGIQIPHGYAVDANGKVGQGRNMVKTAILGGALALGAPLTAGALLGAYAPPAAAVSSGAASTSTVTPAVVTGATVAPHAATVASTLGLGFGVGDVVKSAIGPAINAGLGIYTANKNANLTTQNLAAQTAAEKYAADLQAKSAAEQLAFLKEQEANRKAEFDKTQALNLDQYNQGQARLAPYRQMGQSALNMFSRPIGNIGQILGVA